MITLLLDGGDYKLNHFRLDFEDESDLPQTIQVRNELDSGMYGGSTKFSIYQKTDRRENGCVIYSFAYVSTFPDPDTFEIF